MEDAWEDVTVKGSTHTLSQTSFNPKALNPETRCLCVFVAVCLSVTLTL